LSHARHRLKWCLLTFLAGLVTFTGCGRDAADERRQVEEEIRRSMGSFRPIEPRLTLDTGWVPCAAESRNAIAGACSYDALLRTELSTPRCSPPPSPASPGFREIVELARRLDRQPLEERDSALATFPLLLEADEANTTATILALKKQGRRPGALTDLSAVYLHLAGLTHRPDLLLESLEASASALEQQPYDPHALFNRGLGLSRLNLTTTALGAWKKYLKAAGAEDWSLDARGYFLRAARGTYQQEWDSVEPALQEAARAGDAKSVQEIVARHRQRSREWAERDLLVKWATKDGTDADIALKTADLIGAALAEIGGDRMLAEGTAVIISGHDSQLRLARLRTGHKELVAGHDVLYGTWRLDRAGDHFRRARSHLAESPYSLWADFYLALIDYYQENYKRAEVSLSALEARVDAKRYPALKGRILWIEGLVDISLNNLEESAAHYRQALEVFCIGEEDENLAAVHAVLGEVLNKLGQYEESWQHLYNALAKVDRIFDPVRHYLVLQVALLNARRQGLNRAGLAFAEESLHVARRTDGAQILHYAFMHRASLRYALGDMQDARTDLVEASRAAEKLKDPNLRERSAADFSLVSAEIQIATDPRSAIPLLNRTIAQYERTRYSYLLPQAYGARARAYRQLGQPRLAERDLARQIHLYEASADEILQDVFRLSFLDQTASVFDEMIEIKAAQPGRQVEALEYCERSRYRALLDAGTRSALELSSALGPAPGKGLDLRTLQEKLPEEVAILEFALLDEKLLSWVITKTDITMAVRRVKRRDVADRIKQLDRGLGGKRNPSASRELYDLLVRPVAEKLNGISHLVVVPDKEIFRVPFEALVDRQTEHFLIEDQMVSYAPSAALHVRLREKLSRDRKTPLELALAATGAQDGGNRYVSLPGAVAEALSIAPLYPRGTFLANPSKERFLAALSQSEVLHFSGHAVPDEERPFASRLVLADTSTEHSEVYAYELYDRALPSLRLVVLSACGTAEPAKPSLGTAATLAGPFLAAGVPQVIGSQWQVDDASTRLFFSAFHRRLAKGVDAATALHDTKLDFLHSRDTDLASPRVWGAFVLVGG
jgi:CHAT domain-containing protein